MLVFRFLFVFLLVPLLAFGGPLEDELLNDPLTRGYSGMTVQQIVDDMNTSYRTRNRTIMTASEVANQLNITEFNALTDADEAKIWNVLHLGNLDPFGVEATIFTNVFGGGSTTISNLQAARVESITRAEELGVRATFGPIEDARP